LVLSSVDPRSGLGAPYKDTKNRTDVAELKQAVAREESEVSEVEVVLRPGPGAASASSSS